MAIDAASFMSKPKSAARLSVMKIPNCAAAPNSISLGFVRRGVKSIMAPIPTKSKSGKSSFAIPLSNKMSSTPASFTPS